ncbi:MAG: hypothetical protein ACLTXI_08645, partial [Collinsella sp.]
VLDTSSANELELLSNGQIQAAALATNALLNDKIDRVVYNVHAYIDEDSNIQHDSFFGMFPARGHQSAILTFVWTKSSSNATSIDWKMACEYGRHHRRAHSEAGEPGVVVD